MDLGINDFNTKTPVTSVGQEFIYGSVADGIKRFGKGFIALDYILAIESEMRRLAFIEVMAAVEERLKEFRIDNDTHVLVRAGLSETNVLIEKLLKPKFILSDETN